MPSGSTNAQMLWQIIQKARTGEHHPRACSGGLFSSAANRGCGGRAGDARCAEFTPFSRRVCSYPTRSCAVE